MSVYTINSLSKIERFFTTICTFDNKLNLYLKHELLSLLCFKVATQNKSSTRLRQAFLNLLFLSVAEAVDEPQTWIMVKENLKIYCQYDYLSDMVTPGEMTLFLRSVSGVIFKILFNPFEKIYNIMESLRHHKSSIFMDVFSFVFEKYSNAMSVENNLLLTQITYDGHCSSVVVKYLFSLAKDDSEKTSHRLEALDILYLKGTEEVKREALLMLKIVVSEDPYMDNPENVHLSSVIESVERTLDFLLKQNGGTAADTGDSIRLALTRRFDSCTDYDKVKASLNRIFDFNFLKFSKYKLTMFEILQQVCLFVDKLDHSIREELYERLRQELSDMHGTCSQGYVSRLINVLSGYSLDGDHKKIGIFLSYEDEIYCIFSSKVNSLIREAPEDLKNTLLEEMTAPTDDYLGRMNLTRYLRPFLPYIWNDIHDRFKDTLTTTDLDLYCRKVAARYDC
jgi:hypothetical protein